MTAHYYLQKQVYLMCSEEEEQAIIIHEKKGFQLSHLEVVLICKFLCFSHQADMLWFLTHLTDLRTLTQTFQERHIVI